MTADDTRGSLQLSVVAAATTWLSFVSWSGLTTRPSGFLVPLLFMAVAIAATGAVLRSQRLHGAVVLASQVGVAVIACSLILVGKLPTPDGLSDLKESFAQAAEAARSFAPPVPAINGGVHPLLIAGGAVCLVMVDLLAAGLRRVTLAGLPLLAIYSIATGLLFDKVPWWSFALTAVGYLSLLAVHHRLGLQRWGTRLPGPAPKTTRTAAGIGVGAVTLAVLLPMLIPVLQLGIFPGGRGEGNGEITVDNPITDLRRDLVRARDVRVGFVNTADPDPSYLRISVLTRFNNQTWSAGDREIPRDQLAAGALPPPAGLSGSVERETYDYQIQLEPAFSSIWLPTYTPAVSVTADGDWRYDLTTMDFIAADDDLDAGDMSYSMSALELRPTAEYLAVERAGVGASSRYTVVPTSLSQSVRDQARLVTAQADSKFAKAVALQNWFRRDGGFTYSLEVPSGNGAETLETFLSDEGDGRVGYCEQFASAMAVMARTLGIPSRVAVGFLSPEPVTEADADGAKTYEFSTHDLHAWPELYFEGVGWLRFEPTPAARAPRPPAYSTATLPDATQAPTATGQESIDVPNRGSSAPATSASASASEASSAETPNDSDGQVPWGWLLTGALGLLVVVAAGFVPGLIRRSQRAQRWRRPGGPEAAWQELRASALDLGLSWPSGRSPRDTGRVLRGYFGAPGEVVERPARGADLAPVADAALERLVEALEQRRYARVPAEPQESALVSDVEECVRAWADGATPRQRRRAAWWPRSILRRDLPVEDESFVEADRPGHLVDHMG